MDTAVPFIGHFLDRNTKMAQDDNTKEEERSIKNERAQMFRYIPESELILCSLEKMNKVLLKKKWRCHKYS
jgi:hypothetical protein